MKTPPCTFRGRALGGPVFACRVWDVCVETDARLRLPVCGQCRYRTTDPQATPPEHPGRWRPQPARVEPDPAILRNDGLDCAHLVEETGSVQATRCRGSVTTVWECALFGPCTPVARCEVADHASCVRCGSFQGNAELGVRSGE